jgi:hypothetical protein
MQEEREERTKKMAEELGKLRTYFLESPVFLPGESWPVKGAPVEESRL